MERKWLVHTLSKPDGRIDNGFSEKWRQEKREERLTDKRSVAKEMASVSREWQELLGTSMISFPTMCGGFLFPEEPDGKSKVLVAELNCFLGNDMPRV